MKKHNNLIFIILLCFSLFSCKSLPTGTKVNAIDLLDNESSFYISIPANVDPELIPKVLQTNIENLSKEDSEKISQRINRVYCGMNKYRNSTEYQIAAETEIPVKYVSKVLTPKNGWNVQGFKSEFTNLQYTIYNQNDIDISFPSQNITCFGRNIEGMLTKYDTIQQIPEGNEIENPIEQNYSELEDDLYIWLTETDEKIRFYANKPQSFLTVLTGTSLDLKLFNVKGEFSVDPNRSEQYILNLNFFFKNEKYRKAGKTLLSIAFGLTDSETVTINTNELQINGIKLNKEQLYKLFME